jgi:GNAT superfamily N-acetyltransferase
MGRGNATIAAPAALREEALTSGTSLIEQAPLIEPLTGRMANFAHRGLEARLEDYRFVEDDEFRFSAAVRDAAGQRRGGFICWLSRDAARGLSLRLADIRISPAAQRGGFGTAVLERLEREARRAGIERLTLWATGIGAYAWARPGWRFDRADAAAELIAVGLPHLRGKIPEPAWIALATLERRPPSTPAELAGFGRERAWAEDEERNWAGRALLLGHPKGWRGHLPLQGDGRESAKNGPDTPHSPTIGE